MDINQAYRFCESVSNKDRQGAFTPDDFNLWADSAQKAVIGKRTPAYGRLDIDDPALIPLLEKEVLTSDAKGVLALPKAYNSINSIFLLDPDEKITALVNKLTESELGIRELSVIKKPTEIYPAFCFYRGIIQLSPRKILKVLVNYIRTPKEPNFDYKLVNYKAVYNASQEPADAGETGKVSVDFEITDMQAQNEICFRILQYAGVNLSDQVLLQYGLTKEQIAG